MLQLSSTSELIAALRHCRRADVQAYTMRGKVLHAVEDAAKRGARVSVRLEAEPVSDTKGGLLRWNRQIVESMRDAGIDAGLESRVHAKAIDVDGTLYLDERNWAGDGDVVVRDDDPVDAAGIPMRKSTALERERALLASSASNGAIAESETFGACPISAALRELAREGKAPRLLVCDRTLRRNARERAELLSLQRDGVRVRLCGSSEKLAVAGDRAWLGSANATSAWGPYDMTDWGACTGDAAIVETVRQKLEAQWACARPFSQ